MKLFYTRDRRAFTILMIAIAATAGIAAQQVDPSGFLKQIDENLTLESADFGAVMGMVAEDPQEGLDRRKARIFRRDRDGAFVVLILEPQVNRGQGYLQVDDALWFYDPESRAFSFTSMNENFQGSDARMSDFGSSTLDEDYSITSVQEGTLGTHHVYILELEAKHTEVTFPHLRLWVTKETFLILKSQEYSVTERLLRTSYYPRYARAGDAYIPTHIILIDELVEGKKTTMSLDEVSTSPLPDSVFTKAYIERVSR